MPPRTSRCAPLAQIDEHFGGAEVHGHGILALYFNVARLRPPTRYANAVARFASGCPSVGSSDSGFIVFGGSSSPDNTSLRCREREGIRGVGEGDVCGNGYVKGRKE